MRYIIRIAVLLLAIFAKGYAQENIALRLSHQGYNRLYTLHLPTDYTDNQDYAVVIVLHGGSGDNQSVQLFTQMNRASNQRGFLAVYPQGYGVADPGYSWADGRGTSADLAGVDDVGFIARMIEKLTQNYPLDLSRIYVCGFSNGGFMTQRLACDRPDLFAAAAGLGCSMGVTLYQTCNPELPVPMAFFAGTADPEVPYEGGEMRNPLVEPIVPVDSAVQFWVEQNQCTTAEPVVPIEDIVNDDGSTVERYDYTDCENGAEVRLYKIIGGGHTWPGVELSDLEPLLGETNEDIHASFECWDFFSRYRREQTVLSGRQNRSIQLFPQPADASFTIRSTEPMAGYYLFDRQGQPAKQGRVDTEAQSILVSDIPSGLYILKLVDRMGGAHSRRVTIIH